MSQPRDETAPPGCDMVGGRLGPVGARNVTEVLIGLLRADPPSHLGRPPDWAPTLPAAGPRFGRTDLLTFGR
jgi:hypothetical protein